MGASPIITQKQPNVNSFFIFFLFFLQEKEKALAVS